MYINIVCSILRYVKKIIFSDFEAAKVLPIQKKVRLLHPLFPKKSTHK